MRTERVLWVLAVLGFLVGAPGIVDYLLNGHLSANYGSYVPWGLWVGAYVYFMGLSAGAFVVSTLSYVFGLKRFEPVAKLALFLALVCLLGSMLSIWLDLGHPLRGWRLLLQTNFKSMMGWMAWFYSAYVLLLLAQLWLALKPDLLQISREPTAAGKLAARLVRGRTEYPAQEATRDRVRLKLLGILGLPLVVAFIGGGGALFGVIGARPYWNSGLLPILTMVGALLSGGALVTAAEVLLGGGRGTPAHRQMVERLAKVVLALLAFDVLIEWAEYSIGLYASVPAHAEAMRLVLFGPYWWAFWIVHGLLGVALPMVLLLTRSQSLRRVALACGLIALTFITVRLNIVIPGLAISELEGLAHAFVHPRLSFDYFPSLTEWLVLIWISSIVAVSFLVGLRLLPLTRTEEGEGTSTITPAELVPLARAEEA